MREIDLSLKSHELIKVRVSGDDRKQREAYLARICEALDAAPVQEIGKVLVIWREPRPKEKAERAKELRRHSRKKSAEKRIVNREQRNALPVFETSSRTSRRWTGAVTSRVPAWSG